MLVRLLLIGLKKVDKSEMTHKNPELRASSMVPGTSGMASRLPKIIQRDAQVAIKPVVPKAAPNTAATAAPSKPPKFALEGAKWAVVSIWKLHVLEGFS